MPALAVFVAAADARIGQNSAAIDERRPAADVLRADADIEPAVAVQEHGIRTVERHSLAIREEHRNACAVFRRIEHELRFDPGGIERGLVFPQQRPGERLAIDLVEPARCCEGRQRGVDDVLVDIVGAGADIAELRQRKLAYAFAGELVYPDSG